MKKLITLAAVAVLTASFGIAQASSVGVRSQTVSFTDLDTNSAAGAAVLFARIKTASETVCQDFDWKSLAMRQPYRDCLGKALSSAVRRINRPMLTAYASTHGYQVMDVVARNN